MKKMMTGRILIIKKLACTLIAIAYLAAQCSAQTSLGAKLGLNVSNVRGIGTYTNNDRFGINAGFLAETRIGSHFVIRPEILYSLKGSLIPQSSSNPKSNISFHYLSIPILLGYEVADKLQIFAGPELNYLISAKSKTNDTTRNTTKYYRKFDVAIDVGACYRISKSFGVEARYSYGLNDLAHITETDQFGNFISEGNKGSNRVFQIGLFYKFNKYK